MADLRRGNPEPPLGRPQIQYQPGMASDLMQELAPLLAEDGFDVDDLDGADMDALRRAMDRAVERRNMELFTPVGATRTIAVTALREAVTAVIDGDTALAGAVLARVQPESPDNAVATAASCIGIGLGLLDDWLSGQAATSPAGLVDRVQLPPGHWNGHRAATDILVLARKGRASRSLGTLLTRQGGPQVLAGSVLVLASVITAWAELTSTSAITVIDSVVR